MRVSSRRGRQHCRATVRHARLVRRRRSGIEPGRGLGSRRAARACCSLARCSWRLASSWSVRPADHCRIWRSLRQSHSSPWRSGCASSRRLARPAQYAVLTCCLPARSVCCCRAFRHRRCCSCQHWPSTWRSGWNPRTSLICCRDAWLANAKPSPPHGSHGFAPTSPALPLGWYSASSKRRFASSSELIPRSGPNRASHLAQRSRQQSARERRRCLPPEVEQRDRQYRPHDDGHQQRPVAE